MSVLGFKQVVSTADLPRDEALSLPFQIDGTGQSEPLKLWTANELIDDLLKRKKRKLQRIEEFLRCPACSGEDLSNRDMEIFCPAYGRSYDSGHGNYRFLTPGMAEQGNVRPTSNVSANPYDPKAMELVEEFSDGLILDNGSGLRNVYFDNVVNLDVVDIPRRTFWV